MHSLNKYDKTWGRCWGWYKINKTCLGPSKSPPIAPIWQRSEHVREDVPKSDIRFTDSLWGQGGLAEGVYWIASRGKWIWMGSSPISFILPHRLPWWVSEICIVEVAYFTNSCWLSQGRRAIAIMANVHWGFLGNRLCSGALRGLIHFIFRTLGWV